MVDQIADRADYDNDRFFAVSGGSACVTNQWNLPLPPRDVLYTDKTKVGNTLAKTVTLRINFKS